MYPMLMCMGIFHLDLSQHALLLMAYNFPLLAVMCSHLAFICRCTEVNLFVVVFLGRQHMCVFCTDIFECSE